MSQKHVRLGIGRASCKHVVSCEIVLLCTLYSYCCHHFLNTCNSTCLCSAMHTMQEHNHNFLVLTLIELSGAQQLFTILQDTKHNIYMLLPQCPTSYTSETSQVLSSVLFWQSPIFLSKSTDFSCASPCFFLHA